MIIHGAQGDTPQNMPHHTENARFVRDDTFLPPALLASAEAAIAEVSLTPNALTTRKLPYFLLDIDREAASAYAVLARDAGVRQAPAIPTDPAIVVCPLPLPGWITPRLHDALQRGLRDLLLQGLAWSLQPDPMDGLAPPYALYWSHVIPTAEILVALTEQSLLSEERWT